MGESIKSKYTPVYPHKYKGNSKMIICRSSWERKFCQWCDMNNSIISWASEEFSILMFLQKITEFTNTIQTT